MKSDNRVSKSISKEQETCYMPFSQKKEVHDPNLYKLHEKKK